MFVINIVVAVIIAVMFAALCRGITDVDHKASWRILVLHDS